VTGLNLGDIGEQLQRARIDALRTQGPQPEGPGSTAGVGHGVPDEADFASTLASAIDQVDGLSKEVGQKVEAMAAGEPVALHDIMMSMGKSEVAFNLMLEVRNKLVEAWERLSRSVV